MLPIYFKYFIWLGMAAGFIIGVLVGFWFADFHIDDDMKY